MDRTGRYAAPRRALPRLRLPRPRRALPRIGRAKLALLIVLVALLLPGWLLLRDASLFAVQDVTVRGLSGREAPTIEATLRDAARQMTTLHVDTGKLFAAIAPYTVAKSIHIATHFPHGLTITVDQYSPLAVLVAGGRSVAVAADGTVVRGSGATRGLPAIVAGGAPTGNQLTDARALAAVAVLAAAPQPLRPHVSSVRYGALGVTVLLRSGPTLYFGDATRPHAKWAAAARVLADPGSAGASYIDVRFPERPAAALHGASTQPVAFAASGSPAATGAQASSSTATAAAGTSTTATGAGAAVAGAASTTSTSSPTVPGIPQNAGNP